VTYSCDNGLYHEAVLVDGYELGCRKNLQCLIAHFSEVIALRGDQNTQRQVEEAIRQIDVA
jgi:hypothetical protein